MALAGIEGSVGGDGGDLQLRRDLVEQLGQHGGVIEIAGGELSPQISKVSHQSRCGSCASPCA